MNNKNNRGLMLSVLILAVLVMLATSAMDFGKPVSTYRYSEILTMFSENKISEYTLDLGTSDLTFKLKGETVSHVYKVPNVSLFVNTV
ncbi:MAG: hypothetical protein RR320_01440, partial [Oscillospiraceae bacterium]